MNSASHVYAPPGIPLSWTAGGREAVVWRIILVGALGLFAGLSLARIRQPVSQEELHFLVPAKNLYTHGVPQHFNPDVGLEAFSPHLHLRAMVLAFGLLGETEPVARLPGLVSGLLAILLVFLMTQSFSHGAPQERAQWAAVSSLAYACTPAAIQGAVIIDTDNTTLVPAMIFLYYSFAKCQRRSTYLWAVLTSLAMAAALWSKVTTPTLIALFLVLYVLMSKTPFRTKTMCIGALLSGMILFLLSWYLYCEATGLPFHRPFTHALGAVADKGPGSGGLTASQFLQNITCLTLWVGPFPLILLLVVLYQRVRELFRGIQLDVEDALLFGAFFLVSGYSVVGGLVYGYPKYHTPAIPLIFVVAGMALSRLKAEGRGIGLAGAMAVGSIAAGIQILAAGDLLYLLRYSLRESAAFMSLPYGEVSKDMASRLVISGVAYSVLFLAALGFFSRRNLIGLLVILATGSNLGASLLQSKANYQTGYAYGAQGILETAQYIREQAPPGSTILATGEIVYYLRLPGLRYPLNYLWTDTDEMKKCLSDKRGACLAYSIASNTVSQIRAICGSPSLQEFLRLEFHHKKIASYSVWIRKPEKDGTVPRL